MPYILSFELDAMIKVSRENVITVLETRFETIGQDLAAPTNPPLNPVAETTATSLISCHKFE